MDIWQAYVKDLLKENPEYWTRYANYTSNYAVYRKAGVKVEEVMNYKRFRKILDTYFSRAKKMVIEGMAVNITGNVGKICARRVERDYRKKKQFMINWNETRKGPLIPDPVIPGKLKYKTIIYFTGDDWCRIGWHKTGKITNETVYEFKPSARSWDGKTGFEMEFNKAMQADPLLKYQYLFFPISKY